MYSLREAKSTDLEWLYELNRESYEEVVVEQFGVWDEDFQRNMFSENWNGREAQIILIDGVDSGVLALEHRDSFDLLVEIQLCPRHRGQGIGTKIIQEQITESQAKRKPLQLRVLFKNIAAQRLYSRLGFKVIGKTDTHYVMQAR